MYEVAGVTVLSDHMNSEIFDAVNDKGLVSASLKPVPFEPIDDERFVDRTAKGLAQDELLRDCGKGNALSASAAYKGVRGRPYEACGETQEHDVAGNGFGTFAGATNSSDRTEASRSLGSVCDATSSNRSESRVSNIQFVERSLLPAVLTDEIRGDSRTDSKTGTMFGTGREGQQPLASLVAAQVPETNEPHERLSGLSIDIHDVLLATDSATASSTGELSDAASRTLSTQMPNESRLAELPFRRRRPLLTAQDLNHRASMPVMNNQRLEFLENAGVACRSRPTNLWDYFTMMYDDDLMRRLERLFPGSEQSTATVRLALRAGTGMGVLLRDAGGRDDPQLVITYLAPGLPAAASRALRLGDVLVRVNNVSLVGKTLMEAESVIRAATRGQSVQLAVERHHVIENFTIAACGKGQALGLDIGRVWHQSVFSAGVILSVDQGSPAARAGLRCHLRIVACNGTRLEQMPQEGLLEVLRNELHRGKEIVLRAVRYTLYVAIQETCTLSDEELADRIV